MFFEEKKDDGSLTLYCFNPAVTLLTFIVETSFAIYALIRYRRSLFCNISVALLLLLAWFQIGEYVLCTQHVDLMMWSQIAFASITFLPVLAAHLVTIATGRRALVPLGYVIAAAFIYVIIFIPPVSITTSCTGRFVIFDAASPFIFPYIVFYLGYIILGASRLGHALLKRYGDRETSYWLLAGYASFVVPTIIVYAFFESSRVGFSSILCGFAIFFAFIIGMKILPHHEKEKKLKLKLKLPIG